MSKKFDVVIKNARVIDGTGNPYYRADIGVSQGKIAEIGDDLSSASSERVIDADGLVAGPGFIDPHSHDDAYVLTDPTCKMKILQGVTTEVTGNCGFSLAPMPTPKDDFIQKVSMIMSGGNMPEVLYDVDSFGDFLDAIEAVKPGINIAPLVGHGTIRIATMGWEGRTTPTPDELEKMKRLLAQAMEDGALGFSSGLIYIPAQFSETEELIELAKVAGKYNGIYATHMRNESDRQIAAIEEAFAIGRAGNMPVHIAHHKVAGKRNWGMSKQTLAMMHEARKNGLEVTCDQYPYPAGSTMLAAALPPQFAAGGPNVYAEKLKDQAVRKEVTRMIENDEGPEWENLIKGGGFENLMICYSPNPKHQGYLTKSIAQIAEMENRDPYDVFFDLIVEEKTNVGMIIFMMTDEDIERIMRDPVTTIGSDGIPGAANSKIHPRMTSTFPRVLGRYTREKGILGLEEAVRKMTSLPAQTFRLKTKGLLAQGFDADIVLFDPDTIIDKGTFEEPVQAPVGIPWVFVNGQVAVENGEVAGASSGRVLRRK